MAVFFTPGPSKVYERTEQYLRDAFHEGVVSINHRSPEFIEIYRRTLDGFRKKLNVPKEYTVLFTSSATECWEVIAQSLTERASFHLYNGSFGERWYKYASALHKDSAEQKFDKNTLPPTDQASVPASADVLCLTHSETSTGTQLNAETIQYFQQAYPEKLITVDVTSSLGGLDFRFEDGDVWFGAVQKCLGLPAGLGLLICSPKAVEKGLRLAETGHYNSFTAMYEQAKNFQTNYTPNVLGIYLLMRLLEDLEPIETIHERTVRRAAEWYEFFQNQQGLKLFIEREDVRSQTIVALEGEEEAIHRFGKACKDNGFIIGRGHGALSKTTCRIANFPALTDEEIYRFRSFISDYLSKSF